MLLLFCWHPYLNTLALRLFTVNYFLYFLRSYSYGLIHQSNTLGFQIFDVNYSRGDVLVLIHRCTSSVKRPCVKKFLLVSALLRACLLLSPFLSSFWLVIVSALSPFCLPLSPVLSPFCLLLYPFLLLTVSALSPFVSGLVSLFVGHCVRLVSLLSPFVSILVGLGHCVCLVPFCPICLPSYLPSCWSLCPSCLPSVSFLSPSLSPF